MRRELIVVLVGSILALFVYAGATATNARVGALSAAVQSVLELDLTPFDLTTEGTGGSDTPDFLVIPLAIVSVLLLFGGLPLAIFGLLLERQWRGVSEERRRYPHVPYSVLMFQIVSLGFSALWLWGFTIVHRSDRLLPIYLVVQILASVAVIPVWRRLLSDASVAPRYLLRPNP